jgi:outer membrane protein, heavy metal efflux system
MRTGLYALFCFVMIICRGSDSDTLRVSLQQADSLLVIRNLSVIASHYDVDMASARVIQQKLFSNPYLATEWNLRNPTEDKWFDVGQGGQKILHIEQVVKLANKRRTGIQIAEADKRMTEMQYEQVVRNLRYALHSAYFRSYFLQRAVDNISSQLELLAELIRQFDVQYRLGNVSLQEVTRLKASFFEINNKVNQTRSEIIRAQEELKLLLAEERLVVPVPTELDFLKRELQLSLAELVERGLLNRPEIRLAETALRQSELSLKLERKERVPDVAVGMLYDQAGSYINNYTAITLGLQIPIFNRNQGRVAETKIGILKADTEMEMARQQVKREIESAFRIFQSLLAQSESINETFEDELDQLSEALVVNYRRGNLSLVEFTTMFESYNTTLIEYNQFRADLNDAYEELNYVVGEKIL